MGVEETQTQTIHGVYHKMHNTPSRVLCLNNATAWTNELTDYSMQVHGQFLLPSQYWYPMLTLEYKIQEGGELCSCLIFTNNQLDWSYSLILTHSRQIMRKIKNTRIFTWKTLCPTQVKNHDLPPVGFSHFTITGKSVTK